MWKQSWIHRGQHKPLLALMGFYMRPCRVTDGGLGCVVVFFFFNLCKILKYIRVNEISAIGKRCLGRTDGQKHLEVQVGLHQKESQDLAGGCHVSWTWICDAGRGSTLSSHLAGLLHLKIPILLSSHWNSIPSLQPELPNKIFSFKESSPCQN